MAGKVGMSVLYQPTPQEFPMSSEQLAAVITTWDEETEKADLAIFAPGQSYILAKRDVLEGTVDGSFQQPGTQSDTAKASKAAKEAQAKLDAVRQKLAADEAKKAAAPHK